MFRINNVLLDKDYLETKYSQFSLLGRDAYYIKLSENVEVLAGKYVKAECDECDVEITGDSYDYFSEYTDIITANRIVIGGVNYIGYIQALTVKDSIELNCKYMYHAVLVCKNKLTIKLHNFNCLQVYNVFISSKASDTGLVDITLIDSETGEELAIKSVKGYATIVRTPVRADIEIMNVVNTSMLENNACIINKYEIANDRHRVENNRVSLISNDVNVLVRDSHEKEMLDNELEYL